MELADEADRCQAAIDMQDAVDFEATRDNLAWLASIVERHVQSTERGRKQVAVTLAVLGFIWGVIAVTVMGML